MSDGATKRVVGVNDEWRLAQHDGECYGSPTMDGPWCDHAAHWKPAESWTRANYLPAPHFYNLNQAAALVNKAFGGIHCYLVGSSLARRDFRDVDVRLILEDDVYDRLFQNEYGWTNALWSLICTSLSLWLKQQTDLPIDFQIQRQTRANEEHQGCKRSALGIFIDDPGDHGETKLEEHPAPPPALLDPAPCTCGGKKAAECTCARCHCPQPYAAAPPTDAPAPTPDVTKGDVDPVQI